MYESCWIGVSPALPLTIVFLVVVSVGLFCALVRQSESARKFRDLFRDAREANARLRRELTIVKFDKAFPKGDRK